MCRSWIRDSGRDNDLHEWRNALKKLKELKCRDMEDEVFQLSRFTYDQLHDLAQQQCLLYCALFPEDHHIVREELTGFLIDEGIIERMGSRQAAFDEGHTMLIRLANVSLLERDETYGCVIWLGTWQSKYNKRTLKAWLKQV